MYIALVVLGVVVIATERNYRKNHTPTPAPRVGAGRTAKRVGYAWQEWRNN